MASWEETRPRHAHRVEAFVFCRPIPPRGTFIKVWHWLDNLFAGMGAEESSMRAVTEYRQRARDCRELAGMVHTLDDKLALDHAAQSWERLAERCELEADD